MKDVKLGGGMQLTSNEIEVKIKRLSADAVIPQYSRAGDAGLDITATSVVDMGRYVEYGTGLSIAVPPGHVGLLAPRSSLSDYDLILANHLGILDSNYRGEIKFRFKKSIKLRDCPEFMERIYSIGDRIGQLLIIPLPEIKFTEVEELDETNRGTGAYGSSGV